MNPARLWLPEIRQPRLAVIIFSSQHPPLWGWNGFLGESFPPAPLFQRFLRIFVWMQNNALNAKKSKLFQNLIDGRTNQISIVANVKNANIEVSTEIKNDCPNSIRYITVCITLKRRAKSPNLYLVNVATKLSPYRHIIQITPNQ
jgi:hypothetical protein